MSFKSLVDNYVKTDGSGRSKDIPREVFDQGKEPLSFTGHFLVIQIIVDRKKYYIRFYQLFFSLNDPLHVVALKKLNPRKF